MKYIISLFQKEEIRMANNPYQKYKSTQIETSNQEKLLLMLYDGAINFIKQAKDGLEEEDYETANNFLVKTQDIINELMATLDLERGGEIARNLEALYDYMNRRLMEANINKEVEPIEEVAGMLEELRETWSQAIEKVKNKQPNQSTNSQQKSKFSQTKQKQNYSGGIDIEG
jgi:flagellar protein FliS